MQSEQAVIALKYFEYGQTEMTYLKGKDEQLGRVIDRVGWIRREITPDLFEALVFSIVGQQVSPKAAKTVCDRLTDRLKVINPETVYNAPEEDLRACGLSGRKSGYIKGIAEKVVLGCLELDGLQNLPDDMVIQSLTALPGIGVWTAEMLLIFSLQRPDIVSFGDFAIRRGMMTVYGIETLSKEQFAFYRSRYSPYGSVASFYLWTASKGG